MDVGVPLPHVRDQEADHDEAKNQQGSHDQAQESHVPSAVPSPGLGWNSHRWAGGRVAARSHTQRGQSKKRSVPIFIQVDVTQKS